MSDFTKRDQRFEFRCWPANETVIAQKIQKRFVFKRTEERVDTYLLPRNAHMLLPKVRGGIFFEVKRRIATSDDDIEFWEMAFQAEFPLSALQLSEITTIHQTFAATLDEGATAEKFVNAASKQADIYRATKSRRLYECGHCQAEVTNVVLEDLPHTTVGLECADDHTLRSTISGLDLNKFKNIHYGAALRRLASGERLYGGAVSE